MAVLLLYGGQVSNNVWDLKDEDTYVAVKKLRSVEKIE